MGVRANGGADTFVGEVRPQDVVTGIPGISASLLSASAGIASDFDLMPLMASNLTIGQPLTDDVPLRSGLEGASMAMPGHASPFDHTIRPIDRAETLDAQIHYIESDYVLV